MVEFDGRIELDVRDSVPDWAPYELKKAPEGSPNVLVILYDDTGMAPWSTYGGRISMPALDRSIFTGNARPTQDDVLAAALGHRPAPHALVLEGTAVLHATIPLLDALEALDADLAREGTTLLLAAFPPVDAAVDAASAREGTP